jgi:hypothetical protein
MFLRLFRSHTNVQLVLFFIAALLLWSDGFYHMRPAIPGNDISPLYTLLFSWTANLPFAGVIAAFLLLLLEAILLNQILALSGITVKNNYLPAFIYMILFSYSPDLLCMHPVIPANILLIIAMRMIWNAERHERSYQDIFTAAIFISLSVLFNIYYLILIPVIWIALIIYRTFTWREWLIAFIGVITPLIYNCFVLFWHDQLYTTGMEYLSFFKSIRFLSAHYPHAAMSYVICSMILILSVPSFIRFLSTISEKVISIRKVSMTIVWIFLLSVFLFLIIPNEPAIMGSVALLPLSIFIASWLQSGKKFFWREIFLLLLAGSIIAGKILM